MVGIKISSRVGKKGQIVIPKPIREQFNIQQNTELVFDVEDKKIILEKKKEGLKIFEEFINAVKNKRKLPKNIDWDSEHYSQFE